MTSTASASGSAHSLSGGPSVGGNGGGGMDELLPLVLQLTNAESVSRQMSADKPCAFPFCMRAVPQDSTLILFLIPTLLASTNCQFKRSISRLFQMEQHPILGTNAKKYKISVGGSIRISCCSRTCTARSSSIGIIQET